MYCVVTEYYPAGARLLSPLVNVDRLSTEFVAVGVAEKIFACPNVTKVTVVAPNGDILKILER